MFLIVSVNLIFINSDVLFERAYDTNGSRHSEITMIELFNDRGQIF